MSVLKPPTNSSHVLPFPWTYKRHIQSTIKLFQKSSLWPMRSCAVNRQSWRSTEGATFNCQLHLPLVVDRTSFTVFFKINTHTCYTTQLPECMNNYMSPEYMNLWDPVAPVNLYGTLTHECGFPSSWPRVQVARIPVTRDFPTQNVTGSCWNEGQQCGKRWRPWK